MLRVGIIGCGGRGRAHARAYAACPGVELVACADPIQTRRDELAAEHGIARTYDDYAPLLAAGGLDIVSICTWTGQHREMVEAAATSGLRAIHAEKPMATCWGDARREMAVCDAHQVMITFCHQRRFEAQFITARDLARSGAIGEVYRYEGTCPNLFDWGTHWFDMFFFYNDDAPAEWVMGQLDAVGTKDVFGVPCEGSGLAWIRYRNGREGLLATGGVGMAANMNRIVGTAGVVEVIPGRKEGAVRLQRNGAWETPELSGAARHADGTVSSVLDLVECLETGREPELSGRKALQATELIFATYESSRRRGRVTLPLQEQDSAFLAMLADGSVRRS